LAQKKNREKNCLPGGKYNREGHPHFWEGTDAARKSRDLQQSQTIRVNPPYQEDDYGVEADECYSFDEIGIHRDNDLEFESICEDDPK
jgi:hypothetical protein